MQIKASIREIRAVFKSKAQKVITLANDKGHRRASKPIITSDKHCLILSKQGIKKI